jgi:hypothetical protein
MSLHEVATRLATLLGGWRDAEERAAAEAGLESASKVDRIVFHLREQITQQQAK